MNFRIFLSRSFGNPHVQTSIDRSPPDPRHFADGRAACAILGTFSIVQQRALTQLALDQQLKLQYDSIIAAIDYEGRAAMAVSSVIAALPPVAAAIAKGDRDS